MTIQTATHFALPDLAGRFNALRTQLVAAAAKRAVYRTTLAELEALTTRDLADLGISPMSLKAIAHEAAYGG